MRIGRFMLALLLATPAVLVSQTYEVAHTFRSYGGAPTGNLTPGPAGVLYGTSSSDGDFSVGTLFELIPDGLGGYTHHLLHSFSISEAAVPNGGLVLAPDGYLYGTSPSGVFRADGQGRTTVLHTFTGPDGSDAAAPLILASDGFFYGVTVFGGTGSGIVFRIGVDGEFTTLHAFDSAECSGPRGALLEASDGFFYGTCSAGGAHGNGSLFRMDSEGIVTTLHSFNYGDGSFPISGLIEASDGHIYGTTYSGGGGDFGTIFRLESDGGVSALHEFDGSDGGYTAVSLTEIAGQLYGTTGFGPANVGRIFRISFAGDFQPLWDFVPATGGGPSSGVTLGADGFLYGAAAGGGPKNFGVVYQIGLDGNGYTVLQSFSDDGGANPFADLLAVGDFIYAPANNAGLGFGTLFRIGALDEFEVLHRFTGADGSNPYTGLVEDGTGSLFGTTQSGAEPATGTVYRFDPDGTLTTLHAFDDSEGAGPHSPLLLASDGFFYGTAELGGAYNHGTIFRIHPDGTDFEKRFDFDGDHGLLPLGSMLDDSGAIYGTTPDGGAHDAGTVFRLDSAGSVTTLYSFQAGNDGFSPMGGLIKGSDGAFYGTTSGGGENSGNGTFFKVDSSGTLTTLHTFHYPDGDYPSTRLLLASDGFFYGTTSSGGMTTGGTAFRVSVDGELTVLHHFNVGDGAQPACGLAEGSDGAIYGATTFGGYWNNGLVYRLTPTALDPILSAIRPTSGSARGGTSAVVSGQHFRSGVTATVGGDPLLSVESFEASALTGLMPARPPGSLSDVVVTNDDDTTSTLVNGWFADFLDVPSAHPFHDFIESIVRAGITAGCGGGDYCVNASVTRAQMAVFLLKAEHGAAYAPPACQGVFADTLCPGPFTDWIEQLASEGITGGCGGGNYCPASPVTRAQMAIFLLKTLLGSSYTPPPAAGIFGDVPPGSFAADWIEDLYGREITGGCSSSPLLYCPNNPNTRGQMAVFLTKTFSLP